MTWDLVQLLEMLFVDFSAFCVLQKFHYFPDLLISSLVKSLWGNSFEKKDHRLVCVLADRKKESGKEYFFFNEGYFLNGFSFVGLSELVKEGKLKADIRIGHFPDGHPHDYEAGFRISQKYLPQCFETIERISDQLLCWSPKIKYELHSSSQ